MLTDNEDDIRPWLTNDEWNLLCHVSVQCDKEDGVEAMNALHALVETRKALAACDDIEANGCNFCSGPLSHEPACILATMPRPKR